jgi:hypothetical protein
MGSHNRDTKMSHMKRLQQIEAQLSELEQIKQLKDEYTSWLQQHPLGDSNQQEFDFNHWLDCMPAHLVPCFQSQIKEIFHLSN